jgi:hypothetical protein
LRFEPLEARQLLSVGLSGSIWKDTNQIGAGAAGPNAMVAAVAPTAGPIISIAASNRVDVVPDALRHIAYITTSDGDVLRYDLSSRSFLSPVHLGGNLGMADISPDENTLVLNQVSPGRVASCCA